MNPGPIRGRLRRPTLAAAAVLATALLATLPARPALAQAPGTAQVSVDAREAPRGILKAHLTLPVRPGPLTLAYPKWLPGRHSPAGPITSLGGLRFAAAGRALPWRRDGVDLYAIHVDIPADVQVLEADLEVLTAPAPDGIVQGQETPRYATESLALVEWNQVVLYPAGVPTDQLSYQASVQLPAGWHYATALRPAAGGGDAQGADARFEATSLTELVDSTLLAGRYLRTWELGGSPVVRLHVAADRPAQLQMPEEMLEHYRNLVREARALYGSVHYRHYDFLWILTDQIMPDGIEHHESSDNRTSARTFLDDGLRRSEANLLPHEYTHSWNGKYRRPAGLATPDYQAPMRGDLLWVYEGLTEYLGDVLAARSGLLTPAEFREEMARLAAQMDIHKGRQWRNLQDTVDAASLLYYQDRAWASRLRRQDDFYQESALLWLEADALIRRLSAGQRSLDDFCRRFYGPPDTGPQVRAYDFDAVVAALESVQHYDWRAFWTERLTRLRAGAPQEGLQAAGWRLEFNDTPSLMHAAHEAEDREINLQYSLGFSIAQEGGALSDVVPGSPADLAGLAPGSHLVAVNGHKWNADVLHDALAMEARTSGAVTLLLEKDDEYITRTLAYPGGERFPQLVPAGDDLLAAIARPRSAPHH